MKERCYRYVFKPLADSLRADNENSPGVLVSNGNCASTCAMFSTLMRERHNTTIAVFGGKPGENVEFKGIYTFHQMSEFTSEDLFSIGMAGNQVLVWTDIDTEIKSANLKDVRPINKYVTASVLISPHAKDPLAPPDL